MPINIQIHVQGESGGEIANDLRALLNSLTGYRGEPIGPNTGNGATSGSVGSQDPAPKKLTAAEKKALEQKVKDDYAAAEAAAKAATPAAKETAQQDAKDEAADQPAAVTLTQDSVRAMLGLYVQAFGMTAAQEDGPKVIGHGKISEIPTDQPTLAKAVLSIAEAVEKNPHKRDLAGDGIDKAKVAELKPIVDAARAVK